MLRAKPCNSGQSAQRRGLLPGPVVEIALSVLSQNHEFTHGHEENRQHGPKHHGLGPGAWGLHVASVSIPRCSTEANCQGPKVRRQESREGSPELPERQCARKVPSISVLFVVSSRCPRPSSGCSVNTHFWKLH